MPFSDKDRLDLLEKEAVTILRNGGGFVIYARSFAGGRKTLREAIDVGLKKRIRKAFKK